MTKYVLLIVASLLMSCGLAATSPLVKALNVIAIAIDVGAPVIAALDPPVAAFVGLAPNALNCAIDVAEGTSAISAASTCIAQLQAIIKQGTGMLPGLTGSNATTVSSILNAIQSGLSLFEAQYPPTTVTLAQGRRAGVIDSTNPQTAKVVKLSRKDRSAIAEARTHIANVEAALAARLK